MIFVTVGTHTQPFNRLVQAADLLVPLLYEEVVIQRGSSGYLPQVARFFDWGTVQEMDQWIAEARVVISQAGAGTVISVFNKQRPLILCPRLSVYGENYNDHQVELATALERLNRVVMVMEVTAESLSSAIRSVNVINQSGNNSTELIDSLKAKINAWSSITP